MEGLEREFTRYNNLENDKKAFIAKCVIEYSRTILTAFGYKCGPVEETEMGESRWSFTCDSAFIDEESNKPVKFIVGIDADRNAYLFTTVDHLEYTVTKDFSGNGPLAIFMENEMLVLQ
jgi:hypothetical protein